MGPVVVVEVERAPEASSAARSALVLACTRALLSGRCDERSSIVVGDEVVAEASVEWLDADTAHIVVQLEQVQGGPWLRDLSFSTEDAQLERWRTVGLAVATIVGELRETHAQEAKPPLAAQPIAPLVERLPEERTTIAPPPPPRPLASQTSTPASPFNAVEAAAFAGTGLTSGAWRAGLAGRFARYVGVVPVFADLHASYALLAASHEPHVTWIELGAEGGMHRPLGQVRVELGVGLTLQYTHVSAESPTTGLADQKERWLPGVSSTLRAAWPDKGPLAAVVALRATGLSRELLITNAGREAGRIPAYNVGILAGLRFDFRH